MQPEVCGWCKLLFESQTVREFGRTLVCDDHAHARGHGVDVVSNADKADPARPPRQVPAMTLLLTFDVDKVWVKRLRDPAQTLPDGRGLAQRMVSGRRALVHVPCAQEEGALGVTELTLASVFEQVCVVAACRPEMARQNHGNSHESYI